MAKVIQYHSSVVTGDAIGTSITLLHESLIAQGVASFVACADAHLKSAAPGVLPASAILNGRMGQTFGEDDVLLIHFSFLDDTAEKLAQLPLRRIIVYHNITPGHFFHEVGLGWLGDGCDRGREQLARMSSLFDAAVGDSDYNCQELTASGYRNVKTIPILFDASSFRSERIDPELLLSVRERADVNVLFVGRFVPNKRIERVMTMVGAFKNGFAPTVCLHLVGKVWDGAYFAALMKHAADAGIEQSLQLHTNAEPLRLRTLYAAADAFVSMSDHEGFMVPLVEAFASGCPVIAADAGAIGETMGGAGFLMSAPDPAFAAGILHMITTDRDLRSRVVAGQARRAADFRPSRVARRWTETIRNVSAAF
ncbi:glycosyltransferase [Methylobacterium sp. WL9]|uniref:glycosyltransferase family 4 protein n=1 Tax=Methylobacterium sp. WL9 TaxID=2603898 RepID=UPI0016506730|nr:glycosyltransferase [Methylobacterium sp. WL9]